MKNCSTDPESFLRGLSPTALVWEIFYHQQEKAPRDVLDICRAAFYYFGIQTPADFSALATRGAVTDVDLLKLGKMPKIRRKSEH